MPSFRLEWNGIPHNEISLPKGSWRFSEAEPFGAMIFQIVHTSREMGISVGEFLELPHDEKAIQLVYSNIMSKMEQVSAQDQQDKSRRRSGKK